KERRIDEQHHLLSERVITATTYDPRARPWYKAAVEAGGPTWTPIFMWSDGAVGLDAVRPVYDSLDPFGGKSLQGVLDTSLTLAAIGDFLQSLGVSEHGQTFIMERSGLLVASSTIKEPYTRSGSNLSRLSAFEADEPTVQAASRYLQQYFGDLHAIAK